MEHMQECEALIDLYKKNDVPKILNFHKVTEEALKNRADKLKVYKLIDFGYKDEPTPSLKGFLEVYRHELLNLSTASNGDCFGNLN